MEVYSVRARNTAPDSENRIHDDQTASTYGFRSGLVPGFTVYGYLTVPVIDRFGVDWLERGGMRLRLLQPIYDGEAVVATLTGDLASACRQDGSVCATGEVFWIQGETPLIAQYPEAPLPQERPPASTASLAPGRILGTVRAHLSLPDVAFLAMQDEPSPLYQKGILHPAALLFLSNQVLIQNVKLGPWIHLSSELRHFNLARDGDRLAARARVEGLFERKGHRFVVLDVLVVADAGRIIQHVRHTAIYAPRLRSEPADTA